MMGRVMTAKPTFGKARAAEFVLDQREDGFAYVARDKFKAGFARDVNDAGAAFMANSQVPINLVAVGIRLTQAVPGRTCFRSAGRKSLKEPRRWLRLQSRLT
jgi:hypothetical protein